ncbi:MAG: hypothetical protein OXE46_12705 [Chloroflexi bacterium]|nr:hypothetical protein [Chloroflexota bacterium]
MSGLLGLIMLTVSLMFIRACLVTLGYYKEPILSAFQRYGDEVSFSPLFEAFCWGMTLAYLIFVLVVPSSFLILIGIFFFVFFTMLYWKVRDNIMNHPHIFLRFPHWYREIVDHTTREERRKLSYMWLGLPLRTRLLYNAQHDEFRKWVELVVLSVA